MGPVFNDDDMFRVGSERLTDGVIDIERTIYDEMVYGLAIEQQVREEEFIKRIDGIDFNSIDGC